MEANLEDIKRVNLGCGRFPKPGFLNVDWDPASGAQVIHDLNTLPYPFKDNSVEEIELDHVMEHLDRPFSIMKELHRILKPNGRLTVRVPHFTREFTHSEHARGFDVTFPYYFKEGFMGYVGPVFTLNKMTLRWCGQVYLKKTIFNPVLVWGLVFTGAIIDFFANLSPAACSRLWCYWVGGFEEIEFIFSKPGRPRQ